MLLFLKSKKRTLKIFIFSQEILTQQSLHLLLEIRPDITIIGKSDKSSELVEQVRLLEPDIVLFCLSDKNPDVIKIIPQLLEAVNEVKVVIISNHYNPIIHQEALQLGAAGIVSKEQNSQSLIRAIAQVSEGGMWVNQKQMAGLIKTNVNKTNKTENPAMIDSLTGREREVICLISKGLKNKEIAESLNICEATVRHHLSSIYSKLMIDDRLNLVIYAYRHSLVNPLAKSYRSQ